MKRLFFLILLSVSFFYLKAQNNNSESKVIAQDSSIYLFETNDGNQFTGTIISEDNDKYVVQTVNFGVMNINKMVLSKKVKIEKSNIVNNTYYFDNPHATRYFFGPSAYTLKKGEGYYQNIYLLYNQFSYGLTDRFTIGGGLIPIFLFGATGNLPLFITPKYSFPVKKNLNLAVGVMYFNLFGSTGIDTDFGITYGVATFGSKDKNLSVGLGFPFSNSGFSKTPAISISGISRIARKWSVLTENYIFPGEETVIVGSVLFRYMTQKFAWDFGLARPLSFSDVSDLGYLVGIPVIGATIKFGK